MCFSRCALKCCFSFVVSSCSMSVQSWLYTVIKPSFASCRIWSEIESPLAGSISFVCHWQLCWHLLLMLMSLPLALYWQMADICSKYKPRPFVGLVLTLCFKHTYSRQKGPPYRKSFWLEKQNQHHLVSIPTAVTSRLRSQEKYRIASCAKHYCDFINYTLISIMKKLTPKSQSISFCLHFVYLIISCIHK